MFKFLPIFALASVFGLSAANCGSGISYSYPTSSYLPCSTPYNGYTPYNYNYNYNYNYPVYPYNTCGSSPTTGYGCASDCGYTFGSTCNSGTCNTALLGCSCNLGTGCSACNTCNSGSCCNTGYSCNLGAGCNTGSCYNLGSNCNSGYGCTPSSCQTNYNGCPYQYVQQ